jgi:hypothetical protein
MARHGVAFIKETMPPQLWLELERLSMEVIPHFLGREATAMLQFELQNAIENWLRHLQGLGILPFTVNVRVTVSSTDRQTFDIQMPEVWEWMVKAGYAKWIIPEPTHPQHPTIQ